MRTNRSATSVAVFGWEMYLIGQIMALRAIFLTRYNALKFAAHRMITPVLLKAQAILNPITARLEDRLFTATSPIVTAWDRIAPSIIRMSMAIIKPLERIAKGLSETFGLKAQNQKKLPDSPEEKKAGHPAQLYIMFFAEMWERFGFYLMIAAFVLYLTKHFGLSKAQASMIYGVFNALVYLTPLPGGYLADKLGKRLPLVIAGTAIMGTGYCVMGQGELWQAYAGGIAVIIGNGLFKSNASNIVGDLYLPGDPRRDAAFSIYYMGINIGAFFAPLAVDYVQPRWGWGAAFNCAAVGMIIAFLTLILFRKLLSKAGPVMATFVAEHLESLEDRRTARNKILAILLMSAIVIFFWMAFHQNGNVLSFWADNHTGLFVIPVIAYTVGPFFYNSVNPFFIVTLTPIQNRFYAYLREHKLEPSTPMKIGIGMALTALSYTIMIVASLAGGNTGKVSAWWLIACYFTITVGELHLSPMGLSMVSKMAPYGKKGLMMGVWMLSTCFGNLLCGLVGNMFWTKIPNHQFFIILVVTSAISTAALLLSLSFLKKVVPENPTDKRGPSSPDSSSAETNKKTDDESGKEIVGSLQVKAAQKPADEDQELHDLICARAIGPSKT